jgi:transcription antitermination factor NusG
MEQQNLLSEDASQDAIRWFAVYTAPRHEKRVNELIAYRDIETFLPIHRVTKQWKKRSPVTLDLPMFPSYVFVRIANRARGRILSTPGVLSFVGNGHQAIPVPDREIEALRCGIEEYRAAPHSYLAVGEKVKIKAGPLSGFTGTLVRYKTGARVVLTIHAIMQSVAVEIDLANLEAATSAQEVTAFAEGPYKM